MQHHSASPGPNDLPMTSANTVDTSQQKCWCHANVLPPLRAMRENWRGARCTAVHFPQHEPEHQHDALLLLQVLADEYASENLA